MVDENLFLYDLAVVAIMKNEEPYVQEWIDYHLLAGVDHFFIYDNDSTPEFKKILQPYIDAGIVTYTFYPGKCRQMEAYADAFKRFRFFCRYMAWIDADEFIFPKSKSTVTEIVDEIFKAYPKASGLAVNIHMFGSNNLKTADYDVGVLERFTRRASDDWTPVLTCTNIPDARGGSAAVSTIANPRRVKFFLTPHAPVYFDGAGAVNEVGKVVYGFSNFPVTAEKIVMNHYHVKSYEEYKKKVLRGNADHFDNNYQLERFKENDRNEIFDDGILNYVDSRLDALTSIDDLINSKKINVDKLLKALNKNLSSKTFEGKVETFLTCLNLATFLKSLKLIDDAQSRTFEQAALQSLAESLKADVNFPAAHLLISELPKILSLSYSEVDEIRSQCLNKIENMMMTYRLNNLWQQFHELEFIGNLLTIKS